MVLVCNAQAVADCEKEHEKSVAEMMEKHTRETEDSLTSMRSSMTAEKQVHTCTCILIQLNSNNHMNYVKRKAYNLESYKKAITIHVPGCVQ